MLFRRIKVMVLDIERNNWKYITKNIKLGKKRREKWQCWLIEELQIDLKLRWRKIYTLLTGGAKFVFYWDGEKMIWNFGGGEGGKIDLKLRGAAFLYSIEVAQNLS